MALFQRVEALEAGLIAVQGRVTTLENAPAGGVTAAELAAVQTQVDALRADIGVPTPPAA